MVLVIGIEPTFKLLTRQLQNQILLHQRNLVEADGVEPPEPNQ